MKTVLMVIAIIIAMVIFGYIAGKSADKTADFNHQMVVEQTKGNIVEIR